MDNKQLLDFSTFVNIKLSDLRKECDQYYTRVSEASAAQKAVSTPKRPIGLQFSFKCIDKNIEQCKHMLVYGPNQGKQCQHRAHVGANYCIIHSTKRPKDEGPQPKLPYGRHIRLTYHLYTEDDIVLEENESPPSMSDEEIAAYTNRLTSDPEVIMVSQPGTAFYVHKALLTPLGPYYKRSLTNTNIIKTGIVDSTLRNFIDLLYGKVVYFVNWREAFAVLDVFHDTVDDHGEWTIYSMLVAFQVDKEDYGEYIWRLSRLFDGKIPRSVIDDTIHFLE